MVKYDIYGTLYEITMGGIIVGGQLAGWGIGNVINQTIMKRGRLDLKEIIIDGSLFVGGAIVAGSSLWYREKYRQNEIIKKYKMKGGRK